MIWFYNERGFCDQETGGFGRGGGKVQGYHHNPEAVYDQDQRSMDKDQDSRRSMERESQSPSSPVMQDTPKSPTYTPVSSLPEVHRHI